MIQQPDNDEATDMAIIRNEKKKTEVSYRTSSLNGRNVKKEQPKWIFEIFHDETVNGINQIKINGSEKFIGTRKGKVKRIELMDGEEIEKLTFSGLN